MLKSEQRTRALGNASAYRLFGCGLVTTHRHLPSVKDVLDQRDGVAERARYNASTSNGGRNATSVSLGAR